MLNFYIFVYDYNCIKLCAYSVSRQELKLYFNISSGTDIIKSELHIVKKQLITFFSLA